MFNFKKERTQVLEGDAVYYPGHTRGAIPGGRAHIGVQQLDRGGKSFHTHVEHLEIMRDYLDETCVSDRPESRRGGIEPDGGGLCDAPGPMCLVIEGLRQVQGHGFQKIFREDFYGGTGCACS